MTCEQMVEHLAGLKANVTDRRLKWIYIDAHATLKRGQNVFAYLLTMYNRDVELLQWAFRDPDAWADYHKHVTTRCIRIAAIYDLMAELRG